jgi:hypothetical protein
MSILTTRQREMLALTVQAGYSICSIPAPYHAGWTVRGHGGSIDFEFSEKTGHSLLSLGLIQLVPEETISALHQRRKARLAMVRASNHAGPVQ